MELIYIVTEEVGYGRYQNNFASTDIKEAVKYFMIHGRNKNHHVIEVFYKNKNILWFDHHHKDFKNTVRRLASECYREAMQYDNENIHGRSSPLS